MTIFSFNVEVSDNFEKLTSKNRRFFLLDSCVNLREEWNLVKSTRNFSNLSCP